MSAYYSVSELNFFGFKACGDNVLISKKSSIYGASNIHLCSNIRIDDFCILSSGEGGIIIGNNVHIAAYTSLIGSAKIAIGDFVNLSSRVSIYSSSDDFSGGYMTNPMVPSCYTNVKKEAVILERHSVIGCGSVVLPGVTINEGVAIGALSLVNQDCSEYSIYAGTPIKYLKPRLRNLLDLEQKYLNDILDIDGN